MFNCSKCGALGCTKGDLDKKLSVCPSKDKDIQERSLNEALMEG